MKVSLISYTPDALDLLLFTRSTRLRMNPEGMVEVKCWPKEKKLAELEKARNTIQSSWEFIDYVFSIEGVTRAFTHQLVRHRVGTSFAQQAQRAVDMTDFEYETGRSIIDEPDLRADYDAAMAATNASYSLLLQGGANPQDARGILPTNILTNITFKANLRTLHDMGLKRLCVKSQGEFQDVFREIKRLVNEVHPWTERFIRVMCAWNGTCAFPDFPTPDCPVKRYVYNPETGDAYQQAGYPSSKAFSPDEIQRRWETERAEAQPKVSL